MYIILVYFRQVNLIGEPSCAKGEGASREESCEKPCQRACSAQVTRHDAQIRESGYQMESKDRAKVEASCVKQCFYECENEGAPIGRILGPRVSD